MVTCNLKAICTCLNILVYLSVYAVSISHIVSCVGRSPLCAEMRTATCYCEYGLISTSCADMICVLVVSKYKRLITITTFLRGSTCFWIVLETVVKTKRRFNVNCNGSTLESDSNSASGFSNSKALVRSRISSTPVVVTSNLKLVCTCCNVLIYLSIYAVSISHIVSCVACIPVSTTESL